MDWSTLVGVAVGGGISLGTAYLLERRRDNAAAAREAKAIAEELRTAARLVRDEPHNASAEILAALHADQYPLMRELSLQHWNEYDAALARHLPATDWTLLVGGVDRLKELNRDFDSERPREATGQDRQNLSDHDEEIDRAYGGSSSWLSRKRLGLMYSL